MAQTMFVAYGGSDYRFGIRTLEVDRFNEKSVWINKRRYSRDSDDSYSQKRICETFEEAKNWLCQDSLKRAKRAAEDLNRANLQLVQAEMLTLGDTEPTDSPY